MYALTRLSPAATPCKVFRLLYERMFFLRPGSTFANVCSPSADANKRSPPGRLAEDNRSRRSRHQEGPSVAFQRPSEATRFRAGFPSAQKKRGRCVPRSLLYFLLFSWFSPEDHSPRLPSSFRKNQAATLASSVIQRALPSQTGRKLREIRHRQNRANLVRRFFRDQSHPFLHFFA